jgi:pyruvate formate lyase activating enzyme
MLSCGIQKVTLIDYPGEIASILFFPGCNFRCPYCHNPELVIPPFPGDMIPVEEAFRFIRKRKDVLGGVVLSGGEPLSHPEMPEIVRHIQSLGLKVKIDTNGSFPRALRDAKPDYIAMDIKTSIVKYPVLCGSAANDVQAKMTESIEWIEGSGIPHEWRTVAVPGIVEPEDIPHICSLIGEGELLYITQFRPDRTLDEAFAHVTPHPSMILNKMKSIALENGIICKIRE